LDVRFNARRGPAGEGGKEEDPEKKKKREEKVSFFINTLNFGN
jgi:hypothetical protein